MQKRSKLNQHLETLTAVEWRAFVKYNHSEYHCQHADTRALLRALEPLHPTFQYRDEDVFAAAFPGKTYDRARLKVLKTYLLQLATRFMVQRQFEQDARTQELLRIDALSQRGLFQSARRTLEQGHDQIAPQTATVDEAEHAYQLARRGLNFRLLGHTDRPDFSFTALEQKLDLFSPGMKLRLLCKIGRASCRERV